MEQTRRSCAAFTATLAVRDARRPDRAAATIPDDHNDFVGQN